MNVIILPNDSVLVIKLFMVLVFLSLSFSCHIYLPKKRKQLQDPDHATDSTHTFHSKQHFSNLLIFTVSDHILADSHHAYN